MDAIEAMIKSRSLKQIRVSSQLVRVAGLLIATNGTTDAVSIHLALNAMQRISMACVYRSLNTLVSIGLANIQESPKGQLSKYTFIP